MKDKYDKFSSKELLSKIPNIIDWLYRKQDDSINYLIKEKPLYKRCGFLWLRKSQINDPQEYLDKIIEYTLYLDLLDTGYVPFDNTSIATPVVCRMLSNNMREYRKSLWRNVSDFINISSSDKPFILYQDKITFKEWMDLVYKASSQYCLLKPRILP